MKTYFQPTISLLNDLVHILDKESGFYIKNSIINQLTYYECADDFYERSSTPTLLSRVVVFLTTHNNKLCVVIK